MTDEAPLACPNCGSTNFRCLQWVTQVQDYDAVADSWGDFEHTDHIEALEFDIECAICETNCDEAWVAAGHTLYTDPEPQSRVAYCEECGAAQPDENVTADRTHKTTCSLYVPEGA